MENDSLASLDILRDVHRMASFFTKQLLTPERESVEAIQATIFRVPDNIRRTNADSFEPKMVSLGPYHHGKQRFRATDERIKLPNATNFFKRGIRMDEDLVERTVERFKEWEPHLRCVYSEQINMTSNEFVAMMMLDCTFIAEFLREQAAGWYGTQKKEYLWKWAAPSIVNDMLVAENQFPLGPLLYLFDQCTDDSLHHPPLMEFLCHDLMLQIHRNLSSPSTSTSNVSSFKANSHLLHLFHGWLVSQLPRKEKHLDTVDLPSFPSAEVLEAMRIQFTNKTDGSSFLDITFDESKRSMEIPQLIINDDNISLLRNLITFEQQCDEVDNYISEYVWFMDCLINTDKDVAVLRKHKIIVSRMRNDEEVAHIFNELRRTDAPVVDFDHLYLAEVMNNVQSYSRNRWNRLWGLWNFSWLRQNYFRNRWVSIVVTVAVFFNLLTLVQTVYAVLSYHKQ